MSGTMGHANGHALSAPQDEFSMLLSSNEVAELLEKCAPLDTVQEPGLQFAADTETAQHVAPVPPTVALAERIPTRALHGAL